MCSYNYVQVNAIHVLVVRQHFLNLQFRTIFVMKNSAYYVAQSKIA